MRLRCSALSKPVGFRDRSYYADGGASLMSPEVPPEIQFGQGLGVARYLKKKPLCRSAGQRFFLPAGLRVQVVRLPISVPFGM